MEVFRAPGKWILAGEHAVLRGCPALVFPLLSQQMELRYKKMDAPLTVEFAGAHGVELKPLVSGLIDYLTQRLNLSPRDLRGALEVHNELPVGAGLGASAALCVVMSRWAVARGWIKDSELYDFARSLEDLFHGESSGVDIAVALHAQPLRFVRGGERRVLELKWSPRWELSYSGKKGMTSACVARVKDLEKSNPEEFKRIDDQMRASVEKAEQALSIMDQDKGLPLLKEAVELAHDCFAKWGLIEEDSLRCIAEQKERGALAVKPTGSGGGGYILSLMP